MTAAANKTVVSETSFNLSAEGNTGQPLNVVAITSILACVMALTLFGNFLVLMAFYVQPQLRKVIYYPIISLALADLLCAVTAMPLYIVKKNISEDTNERLVCDLYRFMYFFLEYTSIMSLMVISIERFLVIHNPLKYRQFISARAMTVGLMACWFEASLVSSVPFYWRSDRKENCTNSPTRGWSLMVIIVNVSVPFLVILFCHGYIYHKSLRMFGSHGSTRGKGCHVAKHVSQVENWKMERKATISFTVVIGVFVICWGPSTLYYLLRNVCSECFSESFKTWKDTVSATVKILTFTNSFVNPIIYFWFNADFRRAFLRVLRRQWGSKTTIFTRSFSDTANSFNSVAGKVITQV